MPFVITRSNLTLRVSNAVSGNLLRPSYIQKKQKMHRLLQTIRYTKKHIYPEKGFIKVELRAYWAIIKRRFWIIAPIILVVAFYSAYQYYHLYKTPGSLKAYQSSVTIRVGLQANQHNTDQNYADYLSVSETLADTIVTSPVINS